MDSILYHLLLVSWIHYVLAGGQKRWCCTSSLELEKCTALKSQTRAGVKLFPFECVDGADVDDCVTKIKENLADIISLDGGDIFEYAESLVVIAGENYGVEDGRPTEVTASYYAVAVVKVGDLPWVSMNNLKGVKSCHTGVGKTSGWNTPMGWLARHRNKIGKDGLLELYDPFEASCAPGAADPSYIGKLPNASESAKWCRLCIGDEYGGNLCARNNDERYYSYSGAFRCLQEKGDVAFVKHTTVPLYLQNNYELLCPDGTRASPSEWRTCNLARVPSHGLMMRKGTRLTEATEVYDHLVNAMTHIPRSLFFGEGNLLWKSSTQSFIGPYVHEARRFLGEEYYCNMMVLNRLIPPRECYTV